MVLFRFLRKLYFVNGTFHKYSKKRFKLSDWQGHKHASVTPVLESYQDNLP